MALWLVFLPFQLLLLACFAIADFLGFLRRKVCRCCTALPSSVSPTRELCSIVVLNWNGRTLLQESLPALVHAVQSSGKPHEIILVDNGSSDDSVEWVRETYPSIRILALPENLGFGEGNNRGVEASKHDIVVLLNNDMIVEHGFLDPLLSPFSDAAVFAVTSQILFPEGKRREETGFTRGCWRRGYLHLSHQAVDSEKETPVFWAGGGSSAFNRKAFLALGGFSEVFSPCYFEDTDLGYRAWRRGWKILLAPRSRVLHKHRSSSSARFKQEELQQLIEQRKLWYAWRNFQWNFLVPHLLMIPFFFFERFSPQTYLRSLHRLLDIFHFRIAEPSRIYSDFELLNLQLPGWSNPPSLATAGEAHLQDSLRILIVSAYLPQLGQHGGAGRVFQLLREVSKKHRVSLISFVENAREERQTSELAPYCEEVVTVLRRGFLPVSLFPYEPFEEFNSLEFRERLRTLLQRKRFDIVHFEWTQMAQFADLVNGSRKIVTEIEVNYAAHQSLIPLEKRVVGKLRKKYNTLQTLYREINLCRQVDTVVCVTDVDRSFLTGYLDSSKLFVVNTGVDTEYFKFEDPLESDPNGVLFVGAFRHQPNVDAVHFFCEDIFPRILDVRPQAHLYVVGSSPPRSILEKGAHPNITVTGFVPDIRDYYRLARVVVVPLRTGVGIRGKILEAWSAGRAVVGTPLACLGIECSHGENVMIADAAEDFALWTVALLENSEFAARLGAAGRETAVRRYRWDLLGKQLVQLYEELAKGGGVAR
ncbi:MAG: glycosyltransferase [Acidobacteria bacterium]|nr:glycosyltransferase [Acidobacteriota bacterium]